MSTNGTVVKGDKLPRPCSFVETGEGFTEQVRLGDVGPDSALIFTVQMMHMKEN